MGILADIAAALATKAAVPAPGALYQNPMAGTGSSIPVAGPIAFQGYNNQHSEQQRAASAMSHYAVYSNIRAIAQELSTAQLVMQQPAKGKKKAKPLDDHPFAERWSHPNPFMGRSFVAQYWTIQMKLFGRGFLFLTPDEDGGIAEIWPVPSLMVDVLPSPDPTLAAWSQERGYITGYAFRSQPSDKPTFLPSKNVVYSRYPHPFDIRDGLAPLAAGNMTVALDKAMSRWNEKFFSKDNAMPAVGIFLPRETQAGDFLRVRNEIFEFFGGGNRRTLVARAGDVDVKTWNVSQTDMQFTKGREFNEKELDRLFNVPSGYWDGDANRANAQHAKAVLVEQAVWPDLEMLSEDLNVQVIPEWYDDGAIASFKDIRPRNRQLELEELEKYQPIRTINELREMIGDEPFDEADPRGEMLVAQVGPWAQAQAQGGAGGGKVTDTPPEQQDVITPEVDGGGDSSNVLSPDVAPTTEAPVAEPEVKALQKLQIVIDPEVLKVAAAKVKKAKAKV
jgi:HK97 family phage portal protein